MEIKSTYAVSIIIPCLRGARNEMDFIGLIDSCLAQKRTSLEILFISNQQDDILEAKLRGCFSNDPRFHYLQTSRLGVNQARHLGALAASGEVLYFLDDDCLLSSTNHLELALRKLGELPPGSILGGSYIGDAGVLGAAYHAMVTGWIRLGAGAYDEEPRATFEVQNLLGGNFLISRKAYFQGPFQHTSIYGGEDTEFFRVQSGLGNRLFYFPGLDVRHLENDSVKKIIFRAWCHGRERESLALKSNVSRRRRLSIFWTLFKKNKSVIWFFLIHFSVLYLATYIEKLKKLSKSVKNMRTEHQIEYGTN